MGSGHPSDPEKGFLSVGLGKPGSMGILNADPALPATHAARIQEAIDVVAARGDGGRIELLPGTFRLQTTLSVTSAEIEIFLSPGCRIEVENSETTGFVHATSAATSFAVTGRGRIVVKTAVPNQTILRVSGAFQPRIGDGLTWEVATLDGSPSTPIVLIRLEATQNAQVVVNQFLPSVGVTCVRDEGGLGSEVTHNRITNEDVKSYPIPYAPRFMYRGFDLEGTGWAKVSMNRCWGLGDPFNAVGAGIQVSDCVIRHRKTFGTENGHLQILGNQIEGVAARAVVRLMGTQSFQFVGNLLGAVNDGAEQDGDGQLVIEGSEGGSLGEFSAGGIIASNDLHNPGKYASEAVSIDVRNCRDLNIVANTFSVIYTKYAIKILPVDVSNIVVEGNSFSGGEDSEAPIFLKAGDAQGIAFGRNVFRRFQSAKLWTGSKPSKGRFLPEGLIDRKTDDAPTGSTKVQRLSTNLRMD